MAQLDNVVALVNGDLQDCLIPVRSRFRLAMSTIVEYAIANPSSTATQAQTAIGNTFNATYSDSLVAPGITITTFLTVFNNRHGGSGSAAQKWATIRDWIVARGAFKTKVLEAFEEGVLLPIPELKLDSLVSWDSGPTNRTADLVKQTYKTNQGVLYRIEYSSVSKGYRVRIDYGYTTDANGRHIQDGTKTVTEF